MVQQQLTKIILQDGTINYVTGEIILTNLNITSISTVDGATSTSIRLIVTPESNDVVGVRNQVVRIDTGALTISSTVDSIATGSSAWYRCFNYKFI